MKERPILFSAPMIRAILAGKKSQTRRVVKGLPDEVTHIKPDAYGEGIFHLMSESSHVNDPIACPYGQPGDQLWVRETWGYATLGFNWARSIEGGVVYKAGGENIPQAVIDAFNADRHPNVHVKPEDFKAALGWKPSIHMPRIASRIQLEITGIRVERLQDISEEDAIAEGIERNPKVPTIWLRGSLHGDQNKVTNTAFPRLAYRSIWESINGAGSWDANPWVWCITFRRLKP